MYATQADDPARGYIICLLRAGACWRLEKYFQGELSPEGGRDGIRAGVVMGLETMETPFMDTSRRAMRYVDLSTGPQLGVGPDGQPLPTRRYLYGGVADETGQAGGHIFAAQ